MRRGFSNMTFIFTMKSFEKISVINSSMLRRMSYPGMEIMEGNQRTARWYFSKMICTHVQIIKKNTLSIERKRRKAFF